MKKQTVVLALLATATCGVLAQTTQNRELKMEGSATGPIQTGPWVYTGNPVKATVSTLKLQAARVVVTAPAGTTVATSKGKKTGEFTGNVTVNRGRLNARGDKLVYSEASGQGVLSGTPSATFMPDSKDNNGDPVNIKADQMSLDVDTNVSTSTGGVQLVSGNQTGRADKLIFDEDTELADLTGNPTLTRAAKGSQKELVITGREVRALTRTKTLYVAGGVKLVQGTLVTTGDAVYYDDQKNVAYVVGNAKSVDSKTKVTQTAPASGYLEQRTDLARVALKNGKFNIPTDQFKLRTDK